MNQNKNEHNNNNSNNNNNNKVENTNNNKDEKNNNNNNNNNNNQTVFPTLHLFSLLGSAAILTLFASVALGLISTPLTVAVGTAGKAAVGGAGGATCGVIFTSGKAFGGFCADAAAFDAAFLVVVVVSNPAVEFCVTGAFPGTVPAILPATVPYT